MLAGSFFSSFVYSLCIGRTKNIAPEEEVFKHNLSKKHIYSMRQNISTSRLSPCNICRSTFRIRPSIIALTHDSFYEESDVSRNREQIISRERKDLFEAERRCRECEWQRQCPFAVINLEGGNIGRIVRGEMEGRPLRNSSALSSGCRVTWKRPKPADCWIVACMYL